MRTIRFYFISTEMLLANALVTQESWYTYNIAVFSPGSAMQPRTITDRSAATKGKKKMRQRKDDIWTWLLPDTAREINTSTWSRSGGKWIVFDDEDRIKELAGKLTPFIDAGEIESAKYWNGNPSAINVYSLDRDRGKTRNILKELGARYVLIWEYDYALDKNMLSPLTFAYSWFSKLRTILKSRGLAGSVRLLKEALKQMRDT
jgi:hypothetical protein